jgi:beta-glucosidase
VEARIKSLIMRMTIEEKVGQVIQADIVSVTPDDVRRYHLGSVLNGGNSGPYGDDKAPAARWLALADEFYAASVDTSRGGVGIPIIWGTDAVHGHSNIIGATLFPHNIGLGAANDPDLIERIGEVTAIEVRTTGMEWTFAPTLTVPQDYRWGRAYEGYSSDPDLVARYATKMILGLQGAPNSGPILATPHVLASTKHFIADGATRGGQDQGDAPIDEATLLRVHGTPYVAAIDAGVATIMASFSSWQGTKIAGNRGLITDVLKGRMDFGGFVVTDWNAHGQIAGCTNDSCPRAINAGVDMYMAPDSWKPLYTSLLTQVRDGTVPMARLDDAVARILRTKFRLGLFDAGPPSKRPYAGQFALLGNTEHRAVAREAVRKSLILLKNENGVLPIKPGAHVLVAGDGANDIGRQSGGWTISWQGTGLENKDFPGATSIWTGLQHAVTAAGGSAELSPDGSYAHRPDVAIIVFGETPYAEFQGDLATLQLRPELRQPWQTMQRLAAQHIPVVAVMLTGRPLFVNPALNAANAFVVAWLPGSEGEGIADVLVQGPAGTPRYDFTGRLPAAWPATARAEGPTLFARGFGLSTTSAASTWTTLSEDPEVADAGTNGVYLDRGMPTASWSLTIGDGASDNTRVTTIPATMLGGRATVTATDHLVQEGARKFAISGTGTTVVQLSTTAPIDLTREANGDVRLLVTIRRDSATSAPVDIGAGCGTGCGGMVYAPQLAALPMGKWQTIGVSLKCLAAQGANMARIDAPLRIVTKGSISFSLARVALGTDANLVVDCPAPELATPETRK